MITLTRVKHLGKAVICLGLCLTLMKYRSTVKNFPKYLAFLEKKQSNNAQHYPQNNEPHPLETSITSGNLNMNNTFHIEKCDYSYAPGNHLIGYKEQFDSKFKFYIYDLPSKFNTNITKYFHGKQLAYDYCGYGEEIKNHTTWSRYCQAHHTGQYALEVVLHHKLMFSPHRTFDPDKADMFYIPAYIGLFCYMDKKALSKHVHFIDELFQFLNTQKYFRSSKPHFSAVAFIERDMTKSDHPYYCPYFKHSGSYSIKFLGIEKEQALGSKSRITMPVPYPSNIHFTGSFDQTKITFKRTRDVFILLVAGGRKNSFRGQIMDQFGVITTKNYHDFLQSQNQFQLGNTTEQSKNLSMILFQLDRYAPEVYLEWMGKSVFCLQPTGDSASRKSFFDSILSGCIPVLFPELRYPQNPYPFQKQLNYSKFSVTIPFELVFERKMSILSILRKMSSQRILSLQRGVEEVVQWLQYSLPDGTIKPHNDTVKLIINELTSLHNIHV